MSITHYVRTLSDFVAPLADRSRLLTCLDAALLSMWTGFTPQIGDTIAIRPVTGTLLIVIVILGSRSVIACCQKTACNENGQQRSQ